MRKLRALILAFVVISVTLISLYLYFNLYVPSRAAAESTIDSNVISPDSVISEQNKIVNLSIKSRVSQRLLKAKGTGAYAAYDILQKVPKYHKENEIKTVIPEDFVKNSTITRQTNDRNDIFLKSKGFNLQNDHYCFQQKINDTPVYGATLCLHFKDKSDLYSMNGALVKDNSVIDSQIDETKATEIALNEARQDNQNKFSLKIYESNKIIFNKKLLGIINDQKNLPAIQFTIGAEDLKNTDNLFLKKVIISLVDGSLLQKVDLVAHALDRGIYDCSLNPQSCLLKRPEGNGPAGVKDVDSAYDHFGEVYDFYKKTFSRDSFDNLGAPMKILVNVNIANGLSCPNAAWLGAPYKQWVFCPGMVVKDVVAHEYTHAVTESTAKLGLTKQNGALNEGISDIFGYAVKNTNWTFGEDSILGVIRNIADPTKTPRIAQPDHLFSPHYYCGISDSGGIHINNGVTNKAFYLMTAGGSFNGCTISGQGRDKTVPIVYRALTTYLTSTANFLSMYTAVNSGCGDLYGASSPICIEVKKAMQATEMDQEPPGDQSGPFCKSIAPKTPACVSSPGLITAPTITPIPTTTSTLSVSPTQRPLSDGFKGTFSFDPSSQNMIIGQTFETKVLIDSAGEELLGADVYINYDPAYLGFESAKNGSYFNSFLSTNDKPGRLYLGALVDDPSKSRSGRGILGIIKFKALKSGTSTLSIYCNKDNLKSSKMFRHDLNATPLYGCSNHGHADITSSSTGIVAPSATAPNPTAPSSSGTVLNVKVKFQGAVNKPAADFSTLLTLITVKNTATGFSEVESFPLSFDNGVWKGSVGINLPEDRSDYTILVKGPKHLQKKICDNLPKETTLGTYHCEEGKIALKKGINDLDLSNVYLLTGDVDHDGIVDSIDLATIKNSIGTKNPAADVNFDGIVDSQDFSLVIQALDTRYDEE